MFELSAKTIALLDDIESRIDPATEEDFQNQWRDFLYDKFDGDIFIPKRKNVSHPNESIPHININDAINDYDLMMQSQLAIVSRALSKPDEPLCVRANYGTGILSSLFGPEVFMMPYANNTLPITRSFNDTEKIREIVGQGIPNLEAGFGKKVLEMGEIFKETFSRYPKISEYLTVYHPDTQGPLDICELLWGGEIFYAMYDEPELVHALLSLVCDTYTAYMNRWNELFPPRADMNAHWSLFYRGNILIRNDSAMNLSPAFYDEFSVPYDQLLLDRFGGGAIHFCGRGDHYIESLSKIKGVYGINMSQPEYNDMEKIFRSTVDKGIKILSIKRDTAIEHLGRAGAYHHNLNCK